MLAFFDLLNELWNLVLNYHITHRHNAHLWVLEGSYRVDQEVQELLSRFVELLEKCWVLISKIELLKILEIKEISNFLV